MYRLVTLFMFIFFAFAIHPSLSFAETAGDEHKDDVVVLDNGDRLTGEILSVARGFLLFKSQRATGDLQLDWARVIRLQSSGRYEFESRLGIRRIGRIRPDPENRIPNGRINIIGDDGSILDMSLADILALREMRHSFLGRVELDLEGGITYTKGNDQFQVTGQATLNFRHPRYSVWLQENSLVSGQSEGEHTSRHEFQSMWTRYLSNQWNYIALGSVLNDAQQELDLRFVGGGGFQRFFYKTNRTAFSVYAGAVYTSETYVSELDSNRSNAEILTGINFSTYRFRSSEMNAYTFVFPSVSDPGRIRIDSNAYVKWEIIKNLYWKISFFDNFDSRPPRDLIKNNFGLNSTIGWSF